MFYWIALQRKTTNSWNDLLTFSLLFVCLRKPWFTHFYTFSRDFRLLRYFKNRTISFKSPDFYMDLKSWSQEELHIFSLSVSDERYLLIPAMKNLSSCLIYSAIFQRDRPFWFQCFRIILFSEVSCFIRCLPCSSIL
jgi:hypothetical protein